VKDLPTIKAEWRTPDVVALCVGMREAQDWSAMPILADALQDAGCPEGEEVLARLREGHKGYAGSASVVACVLSDETADAVWWLTNFADTKDCPDYETLLNAAAGHHDENNMGDGYSYSEISKWDESYLHFNGSDAHGEIPAEFWTHVERATGKAITERPSEFSCSC